MRPTSRRLLIAAAVMGGLSVAMGAFGAHTLAERVSPERLVTFETGARYAMYHALALLGMARLIDRWPDSAWLRWSGWLFVAGTAVFSGSLFALVLADLPLLGAITPVGGVCLIAGWVCLGIGAARQQSAPGSTGLPGA